MISRNYDIEDFFDQIRGKQELDAIYLANQEVTRVERLLLSKKIPINGQELSRSDCSEYSKSLKEFIHHVRSTMKPKISDDKNRQLFLSYLESIADR
jgi:hypothetical protein